MMPSVERVSQCTMDRCTFSDRSCRLSIVSSCQTTVWKVLTRQIDRQTNTQPRMHPPQHMDRQALMVSSAHHSAHPWPSHCRWVPCHYWTAESTMRQSECDSISGRIYWSFHLSVQIQCKYTSGDKYHVCTTISVTVSSPHPSGWMVSELRSQHQWMTIRGLY